MSQVDRNKPTRGSASESTYSLMEFMREFPDDATCLDWLWRERHAPDGHTAYCPKCKQDRRFHRIKARACYDCDSCGYHFHPLKGTIFEKSATSLHLWFYAMYLMSQTRCGVSAKHIEREIGVTYKTAWRMANLIRNQLMDQDNEAPLSGDVEADETYYGGKPKAAEMRRAKREARYPRQGGENWTSKTPIFGAVERGGRVRATVVPDSSGATLGRNAKRFVLPEARLYTDEWSGYNRFGLEFAEHHRIKHREHVYVSGDVHTNTIEGFFGNMKRGISGNYHSVSPKWLQGYLNEYVWRYNHRAQRERAMFVTLLGRAAA